MAKIYVKPQEKSFYQPQSNPTKSPQIFLHPKEKIKLKKEELNAPSPNPSPQKRSLSTGGLHEYKNQNYSPLRAFINTKHYTDDDDSGRFLDLFCQRNFKIFQRGNAQICD